MYSFDHQLLATAEYMVPGYNPFSLDSALAFLSELPVNLAIGHLLWTKITALYG